MTVFVTDGMLPWPYGREVTGYAVQDVAATLVRATVAGVETLVPPHREVDRVSTMVRFPGAISRKSIRTPADLAPIECASAAAGSVLLQPWGMNDLLDPDKAGQVYR